MSATSNNGASVLILHLKLPNTEINTRCKSRIDINQTFFDLWQKQTQSSKHVSYELQNQ